MSNKIEVNPGDRYGRLTIIEEIEKKNGYRIIRCKCDCGNETEVYLHNINRGITSSCGCLRSDYIRKRKISINPGDRFGKLTVIEEVKSTGRLRKVKCKCDCGNTSIVYLQNLCSGATKSCGCSRNSGIKPGDRFGMLTVIEEVEKKNGKRRFKCKCICGHETIKRLDYIVSGHTKSCGCISKKNRYKPID